MHVRNLATLSNMTHTLCSHSSAKCCIFAECSTLIQLIMIFVNIIQLAVEYYGGAKWWYTWLRDFSKTFGTVEWRMMSLERALSRTSLFTSFRWRLHNMWYLHEQIGASYHRVPPSLFLRDLCEEFHISYFLDSLLYPHNRCSIGKIDR